MLVLSLKPLKKLTGTDRQTDGRKSHVLSQADALTKNIIDSFEIINI